MSSFVSKSLISAGDMSLTTLTSSGVYCDQVNIFSFVATSTGSGVGTLAYQVSNDPIQPAIGADPAANVVNWCTLGSPTAITAASNTSDTRSLQGYLWVRFLYTKGSGTGNLTVNFCGKF